MEDSDKQANNRRPPPESTRWKPGQSGNPAGRPPNSKYLNQQIDENWDGLIAKVIEKALGGDRESLFYCLDKRIGRTPIQLDQRVKSIVFTADDYRELELGIQLDQEEEQKLLGADQIGANGSKSTQNAEDI